jgi:hypothetical protein
MSADDEASLDKLAEAQKAWGQAAFPAFNPEPPEVITATRIHRLDAAPRATPV